MDIALLFLPVFIGGLGLWLYKYPPKNINSFAGIRTDLSMKNKITWIYAQKLNGKAFIKYSIFLLIATLLLYPVGALATGIFDILSCIGILGVVIKKDLDLLKTFDSSGEFKNTFLVKEDEINKFNNEVNHFNKEIDNQDNYSKEDLLIVKEIIKYLANFKKEDFDKFKDVKYLMDDPKINKLFYKYSNQELLNRYYYLEEYYKQIHFNKPRILKKTR